MKRALPIWGGGAALTAASAAAVLWGGYDFGLMTDTPGRWAILLIVPFMLVAGTTQLVLLGVLAQWVAYSALVAFVWWVARCVRRLTRTDPPPPPLPPEPPHETWTPPTAEQILRVLRKPPDPS